MQTLTRSQFSTSISCISCGKPGLVQWEENSQPNAQGPQRSLIGISAGFHRGPPQMSRDPAIICDDCGATQQD
jgi:hypothetical protein